MEKTDMLNIFKEIIIDYLNSAINKDSVVAQMIRKVNMADVIEYDDEFLNDCFFTLYNINKDGYETINAELIYYGIV